MSKPPGQLSLACLGEGWSQLSWVPQLVRGRTSFLVLVFSQSPHISLLQLTSISCPRFGSLVNHSYLFTLLTYRFLTQNITQMTPVESLLPFETSKAKPLCPLHCFHLSSLISELSVPFSAPKRGVYLGFILVSLRVKIGWEGSYVVRLACNLLCRTCFKLPFFLPLLSEWMLGLRTGSSLPYLVFVCFGISFLWVLFYFIILGIDLRISEMLGNQSVRWATLL